MEQTTQTTIRQARWQHFRAQWAIFRQSRIATAGLLLIILFALMPIAHVGLRATVWRNQKFSPIAGFEHDTQPHPTPPSWIPPAWISPNNIHRFDINRPSFEHILGTDSLGRDVLSVLMASSVNSFIVGITAAVVTAVIGLTLAATAAYYRGWVDNFLSRIADAFLLLPAPIFMIAIGSFLRSNSTTLIEMVYGYFTGGSFGDIAQAILLPFEFGVIYGVIAGAGGAAIVLRAHGLKVMALSFIEASRTAGARPRHIIWQHLIPHMMPLAAVYMMATVTGAVVADGFLAFMGFNPSLLNWGTMIYYVFAYRFLDVNVPWNALVFPGLTISLFAAAFYMVSRGLHLVVEPRLREH